MTRKEIIFEAAKRQAEKDNQPFPYANYAEWMADAPQREAERKHKRNRFHYWLADYPPSPDELTYKFHARRPTECIAFTCNIIALTSVGQ